jgi:hypothetical protein
MNAAESVRFVTLHFLNTYKDHLDEDNYESAKLIIEKTPEDKVIKKVSKILKPFAEQSEKGKLTKGKLIEQGWIDEKCKVTTEELEQMGKQAELAHSLCCAIDEMDPGKLIAIEAVASTVQQSIEEKISSMSEEEKENIDPVQMIASSLGSTENGGEITSVISSLMSTFSQPQSNNTNLMDAFAKIDGDISKKK